MPKARRTVTARMLGGEERKERGETERKEKVKEDQLSCRGDVAGDFPPRFVAA